MHWREMHDIENDMREREVRARLSESIGNPIDAVSGTVGFLNVSTVSTSRLDVAIRFAQDLGCETGASRRLLLAAQVLRRLRSEVMSSEWELIRRTIDTANEMVQTNSKQRGHHSGNMRRMSRSKGNTNSNNDTKIDKKETLTKKSRKKNRRASLDTAGDISKTLHLASMQEEDDASTDSKDDADLNDKNEDNLVSQLLRSERAKDDATLLSSAEEGSTLLQSERNNATFSVEDSNQHNIIDWALNSFAMEIQTVGAESNDRTIIAELNRGLLEGRPTGTTGNIEIASISTTWLEKSIQTALALVPQTERAKALLSTARVIRTLRDEMKKNNWHNAKAALVEAESLVHISKRAHTNLTALKAKKIR